MDTRPDPAAPRDLAGAPLLFDQSTGLALEALLVEHLRMAAARSRRGAARGGLMFVAIDGVEEFPALGPAAVELVVADLASRVRAAIRRTDCAARSGNDIVILCNDVAGAQLVQEIGQRVLDRLVASPVRIAGRVLWLKIRVGLAMVSDESPPEELISEARAASRRCQPGGLSW
jgi:GGDEF domain-containing protein